MTGIVLCGGQSSRMGSDKGLLSSSGTNWVQAAVDKLAHLNIAVKVSVNSQQYPGYASSFSFTDLVTDDTNLPVKGPLLGVLSSHLKFPGEDLFVLACDMPLMEPFLLEFLFMRYQQEPPATAYIFSVEEQPEPLCGIYKAKGLSFILDKLVSGQLARHSMKFVLEQLDTLIIEATDEQKKFFRNVNTHADLNGL